MMDSIYTASSGLQTFSKGLTVISDNVTNVNTFGYKANSLIYEDVHYRYTLSDGERDVMHGEQIGGGVAGNVTSVLYKQGDLRQTGNDTDVAINGKGFFILNKDGKHVYSRNGQFEFDKDGDLATVDGGNKVFGFNDGSSALTTINENTFKTQPPVPTTSISFVGNLSTGSTTATVSNVAVIDSLGGSHTFTVTLTADANTPRKWTVAVTDEKSQPVGPGGSISFQANGSPAQGGNTYALTYQASSSVPSQQITLNFGDPGSFSNVTSFSSGTTSNVTMASQNGHAAGSLLSVSFDQDGYLVAKLSNQQTLKGARLALANFDNLQALLQLGSGLFLPQDNQVPIVGVAGKEGFGTIAGGNLESSNVDLSQQFSDMIIIQRGYQASSQVLTTANEMLQQLLEMSKK